MDINQKILFFYNLVDSSYDISKELIPDSFFRDYWLDVLPMNKNNPKLIKSWIKLLNIKIKECELIDNIEERQDNIGYNYGNYKAAIIFFNDYYRVITLGSAA